MGNKGSITAAYDKWELECLETMFKDLSMRSRHEGKFKEGKKKKIKDGIDKEIFLKFFFNVPGILGERFFAVFDKSKDGIIDMEEFIGGLAQYARGSYEEKVRFVFSMFDLNDNNKITRTDMETILTNLSDAVAALHTSHSSRSPSVSVHSQNSSSRALSSTSTLPSDQQGTMLQEAAKAKLSAKPSGSQSLPHSSGSSSIPPGGASSATSRSRGGTFSQSSQSSFQSLDVAALVLSAFGSAESPSDSALDFSRFARWTMANSDVLQAFNIAFAGSVAIEAPGSEETTMDLSGLGGGATDEKSKGKKRCKANAGGRFRGSSAEWDHSVERNAIDIEESDNYALTSPKTFKSSINKKKNCKTPTPNKKSGAKGRGFFFKKSVLISESNSPGRGGDQGEAKGGGSGNGLPVQRTFSLASLIRPVVPPKDFLQVIDSTQSETSPVSTLSFATILESGESTSKFGRVHGDEGGYRVKTKVLSQDKKKGKGSGKSRKSAGNSSLYPGGLIHECDCCGFEAYVRFCYSCGGKLKDPTAVGGLSCPSCGDIFINGKWKRCIACGAELADLAIEEPRLKNFAWDSPLCSSSGQTVTVHEGLLYKVGARFKGIKARWFLMKDNFLYSYHKKGDIKPKNALFLEGCFVEPVNHEATSSKLKYGIEIIISEKKDETPKKSMFLYTETSEERVAWLAAIRSHANVHNIEDFYEIGKELGVGRFSSVRSAVSKATGEQFAIKTIDKDALKEQEDEALRTEVAVLKLVRHPNIIRLRNVFETRKQIHIVTAFVAGGDLFDRIVERVRYTEQAAKALMGKLFEAVRYLHIRGIVHRDLKPENIMIRIEGKADDESRTQEVGTPFKPKEKNETEKPLLVDEVDDVFVCDFGLSKFTSAEDTMNLPCGRTLAYVAPEVLTMKGYGKGVDIWSLGVIMYLVLRGRLPFQGDSEEITAQTIEGKISFSGSIWSDISQAAKDLIKGLLTVDPKQRFDVSQALDHSWFATKT